MMFGAVNALWIGLNLILLGGILVFAVFVFKLLIRAIQALEIYINKNRSLE